MRIWSEGLSSFACIPFLLKGYCQGYRAAMLREDGSDEAWVLQTTAHLKGGC